MTMLGLTGCVTDNEVGMVEDATEIYDTIDSNGKNISIQPQELDVPGEEFKLIIEYSLDDDARKVWKITDNKKIYTKVYTKGLPAGKKVYIDNVHTDTTLVASRETMNGITQDTMDDRIHNSLMLGFPIDDDTAFYAVNVIEGQNDTFIKGSYRGFYSGRYLYGTAKAEVEERRYTEFDYLESVVYGNKISSSYGLLVQGAEDKEPYGIDVSSDIVIAACNEIIMVNSHGEKTRYTFERNGSYESELLPSKQKRK